MRAIAAGLSDVGKQRLHNEDRFILLPEFSVFVVADGMGGHQSGEVASRMAASSIAAYFRNGAASTSARSALPPKLRAEGSSRISTYERDAVGVNERGASPGAPVVEHLKAAVTQANARIFARADDSRIHRGMGTTVVAAAFSREAGELYVAHAGDSRCYRLRDGAIEQLTRDHSLVSDALLERPDLSSTDLAYLPKNVITRALGIGPTVDVDLRVERVAVGDLFLLCSDGLHGLVSDEEIAAILEEYPVLTEACATLVETANAAGGKDNITAVLIRIEDEDEPWSHHST
jgi:serine/threonine protein phosphatase PrpC